jgi:hypothetical protein
MRFVTFGGAASVTRKLLKNEGVQPHKTDFITAQLCQRRGKMARRSGDMTAKRSGQRRRDVGNQPVRGQVTLKAGFTLED